MTATPETMVHDITQEFHALIDYVTNDESRHRTAMKSNAPSFGGCWNWGGFAAALLHQPRRRTTGRTTDDAKWSPHALHRHARDNLCLGLR
jgi:hypothetical protein